MLRERLFRAQVRAINRRKPRKRRTSERGWMIQTGAVFAAALGLNTDTSQVYQLFALLLCLSLVSRFSAGIRSPQVQVRRQLPRFATAGQPFDYHVEVLNLGDSVERDLTITDNPQQRFPSWEQYQREREPGEETRNAYDRWIGVHRFSYLQRLFTGLAVQPATLEEVSRKTRASVVMHADPLRRGLVQFRSTTVSQPDPLGLNTGQTHFNNGESLLVLPKRYSVRRGILVTGGRHFQPGGISAAWSIGESDEFVSLRDYRDGDSMRKIHWASSAKRQKPVVKEYQDEYYVRYALVLDNTNPRSEILEEVVSVAASFCLSLNEADSMLDLIYLTDEAELLTSGRGTSSVNEQLEALATLDASETGFDKLADAVVSHSRVISGCILVLSRWDDERRQLQRKLAASGVEMSSMLIVGATEGEDVDGKGIPSNVQLLRCGHIQEGLNQL